MRAVQYTEYGPPSVLRVAEVPEPHAGPGQIRIAVRASGVTPGDTYLRSGRLRELREVSFPQTTGADAAGVVDEIGSGVTGVRLGDEVFGYVPLTAMAANAEHVVLANWAAKPAVWSWAEAGGAAGNIETATRVLDRLALHSGQTLLVQGAAGGVGTMAVQLAVARGLTVLGTASERNHEFLRSLGAVPTGYGDGLAERVRALAPGGVDAVFDCAGGALPELIGIAGDPGRVVTVADFEAVAHGVHLSHSAGGDGPFGPADPLAGHALVAAVELAEQGRLRVPVFAEFTLAAAAAAHELSETRRARGKIVLLV